MSISMAEALKGHFISDVPIAHQHNLEDLLKRVNVLREAWGKPMVVTSGYRTAEDQRRINPKVTNSAHMVGMALDIADSDGLLYAWLVDNTKLLEEQGLWVEVRQGGWAHIQSRPTHNRFFKP